MQDHRQQPLLSIVAGEAVRDEDVEREALEDLSEVLERHLSRLPAASSWRAAFAQMHLACRRSLGQQSLELLRRPRG